MRHLGGDGGEGPQAPTWANHRPVTRSDPHQAAATAAPSQRWLVMLYQDADDKVLEQDIYVDLNEAERANSTVRVVSQIDRFQGGYRGDGDWTDTDASDLAGRRPNGPFSTGGPDREANHADRRTWWTSSPGRSRPTRDKYVLIMSIGGLARRLERPHGTGAVG